MQYQELKETEQRGKRYWNIDGLPELTAGAIWLVWGLALLIPELLPKGNWLKFYWGIVPFILVGSGVGANWITRKLKDRLTVPRTGFVAFPEPTAAQKTFPALLAAGMAAGIVMLAIRGTSEAILNLVAPAMAILFTLVFLLLSRWKRLPHYLWLSAASLALAVVIGFMRLSLDRAMVLLLLGVGSVSVLVGTLRLSAYLRRNPPEAEGQA